MKKIISMLLVLVLAMGTMALVGCGAKKEAEAPAEGADWTYITDKGVLIVGLDDTFAPMGFRDKDGSLVGFDIDLANAVGEKLGVAIEFKPIEWSAKEMELSAKTIDCIWNGMSATPERMESMQLSDKYLNNKIVIMASSDEVKIASAADLANYKVGTQAQSAALESMQASENFEDFKANISEYGSYDDAVLDMQGGRIDCIVIDQVLGEYINQKLGGKMHLCEFDFGDDFYAIGFRKGETVLVDKVNEALRALIDDGTAKTISEKWFGTDIVILEGYDK